MAERTRQATLSLPALTVDRLPAITAAWWDRLGILVAALLGLVSSLIYVTSWDSLRPAFDDSYISLVYARNLAAHGILSFDGDTWSTGATSIFHIAVLAVPIKLGADPIVADIAVGVASHTLLAASVYLLGMAVFRERLTALLGAVAISFMGYTALDSGTGLETPLFLAIVAAATAAYFFARTRRGLVLAGALIGLAVLTRPEGGLLVPAVLIYHWVVRPPEEPLRRYVEEALILAVPATLVAGAIGLLSLVINGTLGGTGNAKLQFFQEGRQPLETKIRFASENLGLFLAPVLPLLALAMVAARRRQTLLFALFIAPLLLAYTLLFPGGMFHYFFRYQHPVLPFIAVLAGGGAAYLIALAWRRDVVTKALVLGALLLVVVPTWKQYERWQTISRDAALETRGDLEAMALDLNTIIKPNELLATHDIGAVGYFAHYGILDLVGLVNPKVIPFHDDRRLRQYVEAAHPDYLLVFPDWDAEFLHIFPGNNPRRYELLKIYHGGDLRQSPYLLYRVHSIE